MFDQLENSTYRQIAEAWSDDARLIENCAALDQALVIDDEDTDPPAWIDALQDILHTPTEERGAVAVKLAAAVTMNPELHHSSARSDLEGPLRDLVKQTRGQASLGSAPSPDGSTPNASSMADAIGRAMNWL